jgi:hypothetical protein
MIQFLWGATATSCFVAGVFFLRFWRSSRDRLFAYFFVAFWLLALNWIWLGLANTPAETRHYVYVIRLLAFALIAVGIMDKNRRSRA